MLVVAVVMILVVGPKDLPGMLRTIGKSVGNMRRMATDFQRQFSEALKESELDEIKNDLSQVTSIPNPLDDINKSADELMDSLELGKDADKEIASDILGDAAKIPAPASSKAKTVKTATKKATTKPRTAKKPAAKKTATAKASPATKAKKAPAKPAPKKTTAKKPAPKRKTTTGSKSA